jgi:hypothetical protein
MTDKVMLPRKLSQEPGAPTSLRPSHQRIIEQLDRWANSTGLQPPTEGGDHGNVRGASGQRRVE